MEQQNFYEDIPASYTTPPLPTSPKNRDNLSLVEQLNPEQHLTKIINWLRGEVWDEKIQEYKKVKGIKPFMNEEGIDVFWHFATSVINPIVTMSNYRTDDKQIKALVRMIVKKATIHFHLHWRDYGISRKTKINILKDKLMILGLSSFYKALGAGDRKAGTSNISETISTLMRPDMPDQEKKRRSNFMANLNPFK